MSKSVLVVGSYVQDHAWVVDHFPIAGETRRAQQFSTGPGGKGFNQAVACVRQGVHTVFIGSIGNDLLGQTAKNFAAAENIHAFWQINSEASTASSSIVVNARGENMIAVSLGANEYLSPFFLQSHASEFAQVSILLCQLENNLDAIASAFSIAEKHQLIKVLNPAPVHPDLAGPLMRSADILTPNETEFALLCQQHLKESIQAEKVAELNDSALHELCRRLVPNTAVITLGRHGCFVSHGKQLHNDEQACYRIAAQKVNAVDTTGAGDAFNGGLVAGMQLFSNLPFKQAVQYANQVAALSTETIGTAPAMPTREQVNARFAA
jgi:ribokinase